MKKITVKQKLISFIKSNYQKSRLKARVEFVKYKRKVKLSNKPIKEVVYKKYPDSEWIKMIIERLGNYHKQRRYQNE